MTYLALSIIKDESVGVFLDSNDLSFVKNNDIFTPKLSNNYYQWIYKLDESSSTTKKIYSQAGFDIYPQGTGLIYYTSGFDTKKFDNEGHYAWLINDKGNFKVYVPEGKIANVNIELYSSLTGELIIQLDNKFIKKISFQDNQHNNIVSLENISSGFHQYSVIWSGTKPDINNDKSNLLLMFRNSTISFNN